jgi:hypothetical protein
MQTWYARLCSYFILDALSITQVYHATNTQAIKKRGVPRGS